MSYWTYRTVDFYTKKTQKSEKQDVKSGFFKKSYLRQFSNRSAYSSQNDTSYPVVYMVVVKWLAPELEDLEIFMSKNCLFWKIPTGVTVEPILIFPKDLESR